MAGSSEFSESQRHLQGWLGSKPALISVLIANHVCSTLGGLQSYFHIYYLFILTTTHEAGSDFCFKDEEIETQRI